MSHATISAKVVTWQDIRALRAAPPGRAGSGSRKKTFGAALQQAHELATAAENAGGATKPILLFYALSQAHRAVCAARLRDNWERSGHGLSVPSRGADVLNTIIRSQSGANDLYSGAVQAADAGPPLAGEATVGELWAAHPDLAGVSLSDQARPRALGVKRAIPIVDRGDAAAPAPADALYLLLYGLRELQSPGDLTAVLRAYPSLASAQPVTSPTGLSLGLGFREELRNGIVYRSLALPPDLAPLVRVEVGGNRLVDHNDRFRKMFAEGEIRGDRESRWAIPAVGQPPQVLSGLSLWWLLLLGLSSLARYEPALWVNALDVDRSQIADGLERALDVAQRVLPHYVFTALEDA